MRADFVVVRRGRRYVAEVKTGQAAPDIAAPATRRQLLEYRCAFGVDGVLLVDAEAGRVHAVDFALPPAAAAAASLRAVASAVAVGLLLGAALVVALAAERSLRRLVLARLDVLDHLGGRPRVRRSPNRRCGRRPRR